VGNSKSEKDEAKAQSHKRITRLTNKILKLEAEISELIKEVERKTEDSIEMASIIRRLREEKKHLKILLEASEAALKKCEEECEHRNSRKKKKGMNNNV